jgi:oligopeptide/dipeptide ABC transporter ATP-binding protein
MLASTPDLDSEQERLTPIPGQVPEPLGDPVACTFAPRCPESKPACYDGVPDHRPTGQEGHETACLRRGPEERQI